MGRIKRKVIPYEDYWASHAFYNRVVVYYSPWWGKDIPLFTYKMNHLFGVPNIFYPPIADTTLEALNRQKEGVKQGYKHFHYEFSDYEILEPTLLQKIRDRKKKRTT